MTSVETPAYRSGTCVNLFSEIVFYFVEKLDSQPLTFKLMAESKVPCFHAASSRREPETLDGSGLAILMKFNSSLWEWAELVLYKHTLQYVSNGLVTKMI